MTRKFENLCLQIDDLIEMNNCWYHPIHKGDMRADTFIQRQLADPEKRLDALIQIIEESEL